MGDEGISRGRGDHKRQAVKFHKRTFTDEGLGGVFTTSESTNNWRMHHGYANLVMKDLALNYRKS